MQKSVSYFPFVAPGLRLGLSYGLIVFAYGLTAFYMPCISALAAKTSAHAAVSDKAAMTSSTIVIKAEPDVVFKAIMQSRKREPDRRKLLKYDKNAAVIQEKLLDCPVIGSAEVTYQELETPSSRIDFHMVSSDKLKTFEGCWELTPLPDGTTQVKLSTFTEPKIWVPFSKEISAKSTLKDIMRRLANLKGWVETDLAGVPQD